MDHKALKKLADACRKAGIKHYKCAEFEFTLSDEGPISNYKKRQVKAPAAEESSTSSTLASDSLTQDQLLFWSLPDPISNEESTQ